MPAEIKIVDELFGHQSVLGTPDGSAASTRVRWVRGDGPSSLTVFTDRSLSRVEDSRDGLNVAWLIESPEIERGAYSAIRTAKDKFDCVFTFDKELLGLGEPFRFCPLGGCWVAPNDRQLHAKTRMLSTFMTMKQATEGHRLRHSVRTLLQERGCDVYGRGINELVSKADGLAPYRYTVVIENARRDYYFTEKLIDALVTGTVPLYWGCPSVGDFFDTDGILSFETAAELDRILSGLSEEDYEGRSVAIAANLERAKGYCTVEDQLWERGLEALYEESNRARRS